MKTLSEMTPADYARLGLKSGLEVHQQLDTRTKLFCRCPATRYSPAYDAQILRHMRPTLSELGEYDPTALMEFKTRKEIVYRIARETVCTYEMDDAPPFELNREALDIALEIALLLDCNIVGELHIARKQYLDGSIPTGFQRTTILGVDGQLIVDGKRIGVRQLGLEEDSCREVSDVGHLRTYMTDRLSIPLIEVVTEAELHTPQEVAAAGEVIRRLTRATGRVRTGIGAARQDVNVSVAGGDRVEIKGVPSIRQFPALVHYEALRQRALLDIRDRLRRRSLDPATFGAPVADVSGVLRHTSFAPARVALEAGGKVMAVRLPRFRGILSHQTGPHNAFDRELEGRVRVIACLDGTPNLCHQEAGYGQRLPNRIWATTAGILGAEDGDALVLVWGPERDARLAADEIGARCREALSHIPRETRRAAPDGSTHFERVLPGPDRMYPDTDSPPIALTDDHIARVKKRMAARPWDTLAAWKAAGLNDELARDVLRSRRRGLFEKLRGRPGLEPRLLAVVLGQQVKAVERRWSRHLDDGRLTELLGLYALRRFTREAFPELLTRLGDTAGLPVATAVAAVVPEGPNGDDWQELAAAALETAGAWRAARTADGRWKAAMGVVMTGGLRGRVPGATVADWVRARVEDEDTGGAGAPDAPTGQGESA
jgi:glutamyl-tRNA(Gln) amidotransferase subunit E